MAASVAARKCPVRNLLEGFALTAILQSFPTFATAALLLKLIGNTDLVGDPGVAIFVAVAALCHALLTVSLGAKLPALFKTVYEPDFFDPALSLSEKITAWRTGPVASLQLVTIVLVLSVMAVVTASVGCGAPVIRARRKAASRNQYPRTALPTQALPLLPPTPSPRHPTRRLRRRPELRAGLP